jgi:predicted transcriptional regulator
MLVLRWIDRHDIAKEFHKLSTVSFLDILHELDKNHYIEFGHPGERSGYKITLEGRMFMATKNRLFKHMVKRYR